ncbi:proteasome regulatory particle base subunit rpn10 [Diplodia seriata]|uniref:26S proteasome regulatory subunit rpn10 n=1 Tax=Diplodia seriata TaxID=420778 RepID=A0A0G2E8P8_9PEZI|nr:putative 26s proteasome non-atpase regulatory subunit 4 [Diplodia seriata]OMP87650.1 26S proteasome regulatory subunit rpn10 [Diplodia seriata]
MVLEASMIVVDNSESSRNGDYVPSRFEAQEDAVNLIFSAKIQSNPESSVGLMSMGGNGPEVLTTLTTDMGKILDGLHRTKIRGSPHFSTGINIAALALKHRQNKSQRQRIIVFTCSALAEDEKSLVKLAKRMKKNNINVDIIAFGDLAPENVKKLEAFNENVKGGDGSHLAIIPPSANLLSDAIVTTPIIGGEAAPSGGAGAGAAQGGEGGGQEWEFGVDPSMDPELALALRMSYEEEKARQEREKKAQEAKEGKSELEGIAEEGGDENKPLLGKSGEPSGSGSGSKDQSDKKDKDDDKMDTA